MTTPVAADDPQTRDRKADRRSEPTVDLDKMRRYDVPAPRYTSYPTVPHFDDELSAERIAEQYAADAEAGGGLSVYVHIPYCRQLCWYCACNRVISKDRSEAEAYVDLVIDEIERRRRLMGDRELVQLHFGGGTPTFLPREEIARFGAYLHDTFEFADDAEVGIEIDPRECTEAQVATLREAGFNRASIGVQDHDPVVQEAIHREQPYELTERVVGWLREAGFRSINFDLIYGLPHQTPASFGGTIEDVLALGPDRLAIYSYAHVPWKHPAQKLLEGEALPGPETKLALLKGAIEQLTGAGYRYIGLDHFARTDDDLAEALEAGTLRRNFQGYSTFGGTDVHAFGVSAISQTSSMYVQNVKELDAYERAVATGDLPVMRGCLMSEDDRIRRETIEQVMCRRQLDFADISERFAIDFPGYFTDELEALEELEADGLVEIGEERLRITAEGRLFLRNIATRFDAYLDESDERFSRSV